MNRAKGTAKLRTKKHVEPKKKGKSSTDLFKFINLNLVDRDGNTLLHLAAQSSNCSGVKLLLKRGANGELTNSAGRTPLHEAVKHGASSDIIRRLITPNIINKTDSDGHSPLMSAASLREHRIVVVLLCHGADVTQECDWGDALHLACRQDDNVAVIQQLIHAGADCKKKVGRSGMNALLTAVFSNANINARYIMNEIIVDQRDLHEQDAHGNFIFHLAAEGDNVEMLRYCIESGMDVNLRNNYGDHILHLVCRCWAIECLRLLVEWEGGKDMFRQLPRNEYGDTPLRYAVVNGDFEMMQLFLSADPPLDDQDQRGETALSIAVDMNKFEIAELLLKKGADASIPDKKGLLPAQKCFRRRCKMHILLCHPEVRDFSGCTLCSGTDQSI